MSFLKNDIESIFIEMSIPNVTRRLVIGVIYRPPTGNLVNFNNYLYNILSDISSNVKHGFVMGDFNVDLCKSSANEVLNNLTSCGFNPTISKPTRVTNSCKSLIDNILTNTSCIDESITVDTSGILVTDITDHFPIFIQTSIQSNSAEVLHTYSRNYSTRNVQSFLIVYFPSQLGSCFIKKVTLTQLLIHFLLLSMSFTPIAFR